MTARQLRSFEQFKELPEDYLNVLGFENARNARIVRKLLQLPGRSQVLVFACSVAHAEILTMALNSASGRQCAAALSAQTPRTERVEIVERFRRKDGIRFLCNVGVLTVGFDAPRVDAVCITRPTTSALRYEQMVGRGLRGPKNGGTRECIVLDVQDEGLPDEIQSYGRVLWAWERRGFSRPDVPPGARLAATKPSS
jgi:superfamily II DNA or RNA helicase